MLAVIPAISFILIMLVIRRNKLICWRRSFLSASIIWGVLVTATTELLSTFRLMDFPEVLVLWITVIVLAPIALIRGNKGAILSLRELPQGMFSRSELIFLAGMALIIITVGVTALISPPNNWDSMTYHMSRVAHWYQNKSVANYPTSFLPQAYQGPWAEFAILHFQILTKGDRFANIVQWFSLFGTGVGVSLLAKQFGAGLRGQIFASVFSVTIPMGILQGSSTQTDYVVSFWLVCFAYQAVIQRGNNGIFYSLAAGASLGLAILTKPTAYIYAFPIMAWLSLSLIKARPSNGLKRVILIVATALIINFGHYMRNSLLFESPLGPTQEGDHKYSNDIFTTSSILSNAIRNLGLHFGTPIIGLNIFLEKEIYDVHNIMGLDTNDKRTTWPGTKFHVSYLSMHEDLAGNPIHLFLIMISPLILVTQRGKLNDPLSYLSCLVLAFLLFCLIVRWQPWHSRLHLPLFVLWSPLIGLSFSKISRFSWLADLCMIVLLLGAIPYMLYNKSRPLLGQGSILLSNRTDLYFNNRRDLAKPYIESARFLLQTQCSNVGLILPEDSYEYPLWVLLNRGLNKTRMENVNVTNISGAISDQYPFDTFIPCSVIVLNDKPPNVVYVKGVSFLQKWFSTPISVFMRE